MILSEPPETIVSVLIYTPLRIITSRHPSGKTEAKRCTFYLSVSTSHVSATVVCRNLTEIVASPPAALVSVVTHRG
jgi:hypothetical protein